MTLFRIVMFGSLVAAPPSAAQVESSNLPNPIFMQAGSTILWVPDLARELRDSAANPMTLVFVSGRSCTTINEIATDVVLAATALLSPQPLKIRRGHRRHRR